MTDEVNAPAEAVTPATPIEATPAPSALSDDDRFVEESLGDFSETPAEQAEETKEEQPQEPKPETVAEPEPAPGKTDETPKSEEPEEKVVEPKEEPKPIFTPTEPTRLDKRIAKVYFDNLVLAGEKTDDIDVTKVMEEVAKYPHHEKTTALKRLLSEHKKLRGQEDDGRLSEEDNEAIMDAEVERRLRVHQQEIAQREWQEDLIKTVESHPELDERTKQYDPILGKAVERLVEKGMKASEALAFINQSTESVLKREKEEREKQRQKELSGSVTANNPQGTVPEKPKDPSDAYADDILGL